MISGIDISHYQGQPDYATVQQQNFRFIIHKATEGATWQDPMYHKNRANMQFTLWGAYHLFRPDSPNDTNAEIDNFLTHAQWRPGDLPPFLDVEHRWINESPTAEVDVLNILTWASRIQQALGTWPILYISPRTLQKLEPYTAYLKHLCLWIADHDNDPTDEIPIGFIWLFWQYTSNGPGKASGFESNGLDMNQFNGNLQDLYNIANND